MKEQSQEIKEIAQSQEYNDIAKKLREIKAEKENIKIFKKLGDNSPASNYLATLKECLHYLILFYYIKLIILIHKCMYGKYKSHSCCCCFY